MRQTYLIARREYISYVTTFGFWLSLALVPVFMSLGALMPILADRSAPIRYYAVIADDPALAAALDQRIARDQRANLRDAVGAAARVRGDEDARDRALAAFDAADDPQAGLTAALETLGLGAEAAERFTPPISKLRQTAAPAQTIEDLRPYLLGSVLVDTEDGPQPLHAAIALRRTADGGVDIDYWSANLAANDLARTARRAVRDLMREELLTSVGLEPTFLQRIDRVQPRLREFNPARMAGEARVTLADRLPFLMGFALGFLLWVVVFSVVNMLLSSIIEEKSSKVLETLLASARMHEILTGKLFGVAAVSATLLGVWAMAATLGVTLAGGLGVTIPSDIAAVVFDPGLLIPFVGYFITGYLMYGAIFLAIGSLCETIQEAQSLMSPMILILMAPMFAMAMGVQNPEAGFLTVMSWIPLYTPFVMLLRLPTDPPLWEVIGTTALLVVTIVAVLWAAGGVFRAGVTGRAGVGSIAAFFKGLVGSRNKGAEAGDGAA